MNDKPFECPYCKALYSSSQAAIRCCQDTARPWDNEENWD